MKYVFQKTDSDDFASFKLQEFIDIKMVMLLKEWIS